MRNGNFKNNDEIGRKRLFGVDSELRIQLGSHTDCRGTDLYNEGLADRRSKAAVKYIIDYGIDASRLTAKSYGEY